jgi:hypothetical protein
MEKIVDMAVTLAVALAVGAGGYVTTAYSAPNHASSNAVNSGSR